MTLSYSLLVELGLLSQLDRTADAALGLDKEPRVLML